MLPISSNDLSYQLLNMHKNFRAFKHSAHPAPTLLDQLSYKYSWHISLSVTGESIISPGAREGLIPLVVPLSKNRSGMD